MTMSINIYVKTVSCCTEERAKTMLFFASILICMHSKQVLFNLTMSYPAMFALVTCSQVNLSRLETLTCAVYQSAANGLQKHTRNVAIIYKEKCKSEEYAMRCK